LYIYLFLVYQILYHNCTKDYNRHKYNQSSDIFSKCSRFRIRPLLPRDLLTGVWKKSVWPKRDAGRLAKMQLEAADVPSLRSVVARCRVRSHSASIRLLIEIPVRGLEQPGQGLTAAGVLEFRWAKQSERYGKYKLIKSCKLKHSKGNCKLIN